MITRPMRRTAMVASPVLRAALGQHDFDMMRMTERTGGHGALVRGTLSKDHSDVTFYCARKECVSGRCPGALQ